VLTVRRLKKRFGKKQAVDGIDLRVRSGEVVGLVGPNGAGKSTLIRCICDHTRPDEGEIVIAGHPLHGPDGRALNGSWQQPREQRVEDRMERIEAKRHLGYVPEIPRVFERVTPFEHLYWQAAIYKLEHWQGRAESLLESLDLKEVRKKNASTLSKGQKMKVMFAMAVLHQPRLLVLDEPFMGIDPTGSHWIREEMSRLAKQGSGILVTSHTLSLIEKIADRVIIINHGRVAAEGSIDQLQGAMGEEKDLEDLFLEVTRETEV